MKINDAVARLVRAGDENSAMWQKLHEAIDGLAKTLAKYYPGGGAVNCLRGAHPLGIVFKHWPSGEYEIKGEMSSNRPRVFLTQSKKSMDDVLEFCLWVSQYGLLDHVSEQLEQQTKKLAVGASSMSNFANKTAPNPLVRYPWLKDMFRVESVDVEIIDTVSGMREHLRHGGIRKLSVHYIEDTSLVGLKSTVFNTLSRLEMSDCEALDKDGTVIGSIMTGVQHGPDIKWNFDFEVAKFLVFFRRFPLGTEEEVVVYEIKKN